MMIETELLEQTRQLLKDPLFGEHDLDASVRLLLEAEYLRRVGRYRRLDRTLMQKYGMPFEDFVARRMVHQQGYTWDVETDAIEWETAVSGMRTLEDKLQELRECSDVQSG